MYQKTEYFKIFYETKVATVVDKNIHDNMYILHSLGKGDGRETIFSLLIKQLNMNDRRLPTDSQKNSERDYLQNNVLCMLTIDFS